MDQALNLEETQISQKFIASIAHLALLLVFLPLKSLLKY